MPSSTDWNSRHYRARTKHRGVDYFIGWYDTKEEATVARLRFRRRKGWETDIVVLRAMGRDEQKVRRSLGLYEK